jgi:wyosine [tRNA(Phe)-imidazoG37] synthetase (radical SAM superfamily)
MPEKLNTADHDTARSGLTYIYPVVSRRAGGVSVGVNLNPNHACNWRCIYCQVPELVRGAAPPLDLELLVRELEQTLDDIVHGDYLATHVPAPYRRLVDVALAGDGEPTTSHQFDQVIDVVGQALTARDLVGRTNIVVISNGSLVDRPEVLRGLERLGELQGELWFKLDSATAAGRRALNDTGHDIPRVRRSMALVAARCRLRIQTMMLALDGAGPSTAEREAYVALLRAVLEEGTLISDVMLYGLARPSMQPEAPRLSKVSTAQMEAFARQIRALGIDVMVHP